MQPALIDTSYLVGGGEITLLGHPAVQLHYVDVYFADRVMKMIT